MTKLIRVISLCLLCCIFLAACNPSSLDVTLANHSTSSSTTNENDNTDNSVANPQFYVPSRVDNGSRLVIYYCEWSNNSVDIYQYDTLISHREFDKNGVETTRADYPYVYSSNAYTYHSNGNISKETVFESDGTVLGCNEYTESGILYKCTKYRTDGTVQSEIYYNEYGDETIYIAYGQSSYGVFTLKRVSTYTAPHTPSKDVIYYDDDPSSMTEYEYTPNGNLIRYTSTNLETMNTNYYTECSYDACNNLTARITYNPDGSVREFTRYEYTYNADGNITQKEESNSNGECWISGEYEYDENGNRSSQVLFNSDGTDSSRLKFEWTAASEAQYTYYLNYLK